MAIYDENSCSRCGGIRVPRSTLCADCLVSDNIRLKHSVEYVAAERIKTNTNWEKVLFERDKELMELKDSLASCKRLLRHVFHAYNELKGES